MFLGMHYIGNDIVLNLGDGEYWKKVLGPVFIYLNSNPKNGNLRALWDDSKAQAQAEVGKWPYRFPGSPDFAKAGDRGSVAGRLLVRDRYVSKADMPAGTAFVGLAAPGQPGSWATECKVLQVGRDDCDELLSSEHTVSRHPDVPMTMYYYYAQGYQFWTRATTCGRFTVGNVRAGVYNLYAWVPGFLGDFMRAAPVTVTSGGDIDLGDLVFEPPRSGPTLWEIGLPDRTVAEFFVPDADPKYANKLYLNMDKLLALDHHFIFIHVDLIGSAPI
jgi:rhamnogalacturonan endolyase